MFRKYQAVIWIFMILFAESIMINGMHQINLQFSKENNARKVNIQNMEQYIQTDLQQFPIPITYQKRLYFEDTYGAARENGSHEGCDIIDQNNFPGEIPVVSATDGIVTNVGWLYLGGYRIGITSGNGIYYYYAHLDSYATGIEIGKQVQAGQLIGFMGNSGEGEEGTKGKFVTHLHFGIYIKDEDGNEKSVNPYPFLLEIGKE